MPRPFGPAFHETAPNELLQYDYLNVGPSSADPCYILLLRDDHSDFKQLHPTADMLPDTTANAIIYSSASFRVPKAFMSDGPSQFGNDTLRRVAKELKYSHHFTLPCWPWSNRAVERLAKEVLRTFRAIQSELQHHEEEWPDLVPIVQSALNHYHSPQRDDVAPITAFTGLDPLPPIHTFIRRETSSEVTIAKAQREQSINISEL